MKEQEVNTFKKEHRIGYFQKDNPGKTIYIGNLNYQITESDIFKIFSKFGTVKYVKLVVDLETDQSKGIAFVQMPKTNEAMNAINTLDGQVIDGRTVKVSEAIPQKTPSSLKKIKAAKPIKAEPVAPVEEKVRKPVRKRDKKTGLDVLMDYLGSKR